MLAIQCTAFTANEWANRMKGQVCLLVGSGSYKKYEPVTISGDVGDWTITRQSGLSHAIDWAWTFYVVYPA